MKIENELDEDNKTASIAVQGRETKGQGTVAAVITNRLEQVNGKTKVTAITDLKITGRPAQFGRGIMEDVANAMMEKFAVELEKEIQRGSAGGPAAPVTEGVRDPATNSPPTDLGEMKRTPSIWATSSQIPKWSSTALPPESDCCCSCW